MFRLESIDKFIASLARKCHHLANRTRAQLINFFIRCFIALNRNQENEMMSSSVVVEHSEGRMNF